MNPVILALAPVAAVLIYVYIRDKYEKEPLKLLLLAFVGGMIIVLPVFFVEYIWKYIFPQTAVFEALGPGLLEEFFKFLAFMILIWKKDDFNEKFDGIVYAVYISLGFAAVENIIYILVYYKESWLLTGIFRGVFSIPGHGFFGALMGFYLGKAKFGNKNNIFSGLLWAILAHFLYDYLLMINRNDSLTIYFVFFVAFFFFVGFIVFAKMKKLSDQSVFRNGKDLDDIQ